jgi:hypothetical protein
VFSLLLAFTFMSGECGGSSNDNVFNFAGGAGTSEDPRRITTVGRSDEVLEHHDGHFALTDDIDLTSFETLAPIGVFVPISDSLGRRGSLK